jgi:hypothetical protein
MQLDCIEMLTITLTKCITYIYYLGFGVKTRETFLEHQAQVLLFSWLKFAECNCTFPLRPVLIGVNYFCCKTCKEALQASAHAAEHQD